ncbi:bifunctional 3,4-dihydroxy-2-butanone-4-phosphate synthase/GTP cyclohydrolase II [Candidatus Palauibacter sp.]|uniref:bifunctional 3,4-dihydroxy-2-butanone-4-phosphate synthase/GTP cyclohydrolase II n=1 Tax=Candidatus Palauibacter sp. TaxID=3101350 RepID=UPI003B026324
MPTHSVETAIERIRSGGLVIIADDEDRENEGDLVCAADSVTSDAINFMCTHARGLICLTLPEEIADRLDLPLMTNDKLADPNKTAFTVSIDARQDFGISTGISAQDRARTIRVAVDPQTRPSDLMRPGHIFPLRAKPGGVLQRVGQTEASVDLARLAGLTPAGVICEILNPDGTMARRPELEVFSEEHDIPFITVAALVSHRLRTESLVRRIAEAELPTPWGDFRIVGYANDVDDREHVALVRGDVAGQEDVLVRVHSRCLTGDVFHSHRCDCGDQLEAAMRRVVEAGAGVIVYLDQEGRGIGLLNKLRAYELQDEGHDTVEANEALGFPPDLRNYGIGAQILADLGLHSIRILTNNPKKLAGLEGFGLVISDRVPLELGAVDDRVIPYLRAKREKLGHLTGSA